MPYFYKVLELPEYKDLNWHIQVTPFYQWTIDNVLPTLYTNQELIEEGNIVYVAKQRDATNWIVKKVVDNLNDTYTVSYATKVNNPLYTNYSSALANRATLAYESNLMSIIT